MKSAIITGATGFIGSKFVEYLVEQDVLVIALGRKRINEKVFSKKILDSNKFKYIQMDLNEFESLPDLLSEENLDVSKNCIFYHFAWEGKSRLTDGDIADQIHNVKLSARAVKISKIIGCEKFINIGTQEEIFAEKYLKTGKWKNNTYHSHMGVYAISKLASDDMCSLISYLNKIDYVHIRFSVILDSNNLDSGYLASVFKKIMNNEEYDPPKNNQLFDIILIEDAIKAFYLIGLHAKNKDDIFVGSGTPKTLNDYFVGFKAFLNNYNEKRNVSGGENLLLNKKHFSINRLQKLTGFKPSSNIYSAIQKEVI